MTRKEALEFLELPEDASTDIIKQRMAEYQSQFEEIVEGSKSDFLRTVNSRKLEKIQQIKRSFSEWNIIDNPSKLNETVESEHALILQEDDDEVSIDQTIILSYASKPDPGTKQKKLPPAWLLKHTEEKTVIAFTLTEGENYIGRKAPATLSPFIVIDDDNYLSRVHAAVSVESEEDGYSFYIFDAGAISTERPSKNGTYLNGDTTRVLEKKKLQDEDTIQVGMTKLVLRVNKGDKPVEKIIEEVAASDYIASVILE